MGKQTGRVISQQANPRGTFLKVADSVKRQMESDPDMTELPPLAEVMRDHKVSRGVALRAFGMLRQEGMAEPVPGGERIPTQAQCSREER